MSGQQMNGYWVPQESRKRKRRPPKKGPYDEYPLEVREFLQIVEGVTRRALAEDANADNPENALYVDPGAQEPSREQLLNWDYSLKSQVALTGRNVEDNTEMVNLAGESRIKRT